MRYWGCILLIVPLLIMAAGCARVPKPPEAAMALDQPLPPYEPQKTNLTPEQKYLSELLAKHGYNGTGPKPTIIVVHKLSRKLTFYQGLTPLKTYPVVLGNDPRNDKLSQGDTCTPEGVYHIRAKYPHKRWDYFMWLSYPNTRDWLKFAKAKKAGRLPPDADIGGDVGIHGTEDPLRNLSGINWTKGCISLMNKDLEEIYPLVDDKTLVVIEKQ
ncbi:MAG: L,D-transpeptidase family protein [Deltaproteobacteria bacterium]|nr:L,D-transpeptidase family protein [Deltaproteobacteria bacterium]